MPSNQMTVDTLNRPDTVPLLGLPQADLFMVVGCALTAFALGSMANLDLIAIGMGAGGALVGILLIWISPSYLTSIEWLQTLRHFLTRQRTVNNVADAEAEQQDRSLFFDAVVDDEKTQDLTHVKRYYPQAGVVERTDGRMIAGLELQPTSLDFAQQGDLDRIAAACEQFANNDLTFDMQLYATTRPFPVEDHVSDLEDRLDDDDMAQHPVMKAVVEDIVETRPEQLESSGTSPVHYYCLVKVSKDEIRTDTHDKSPAEKLVDLPVVGVLFGMVINYQQALSEDERRLKMIRKLDERLATINSGLVQDITGYEAHRMPVSTWIGLMEEFWQGTDPDISAFDDQTRHSPAVGGVGESATGGTEATSGHERASDRRTPSGVDGDEDDESPASESDPSLLTAFLAGLPVTRRFVNVEMSDTNAGEEEPDAATEGDAASDAEADLKTDGGTPITDPDSGEESQTDSDDASDEDHKEQAGDDGDTSQEFGGFEGATEDGEITFDDDAFGDESGFVFGPGSASEEDTTEDESIAETSDDGDPAVDDELSDTDNGNDENENDVEGETDDDESDRTGDENEVRVEDEDGAVGEASEGNSDDTETDTGEDADSDDGSDASLLLKILAGLPLLGFFIGTGDEDTDEADGSMATTGSDEDDDDTVDGETPATDEDDSEASDAAPDVTASVDGPAPDPDVFEYPEPDVPTIEALHQRQLAPESIERNYRSITAGAKVRQTMFAEGWPDELQLGALRDVFMDPDLHFDLSMHFSPRDREKALSKAERRAHSLQTDANAGTSGFEAKDKREEAEWTAALRDKIDAGQQPFDVSLYVSAYAPRGEQSTLDSRISDLRSTFKDAPTNISLKTVAGRQTEALQSTAPICKDVVARETAVEPKQLLLGRGVGALLGSMSKSTLMEAGGVEMGEHAFTGTPIIKDPFESETNYNWIVVGDSGSGKSYQTKQMALRTMISQPDTKLIILDPLQGFGGISEALDAARITIGGNRGLNPLEIRPPTEQALAGSDDLDPLSQKIKDVMSFFENFADTQGVSLGQKRSVLSTAVKKAYERKGITHAIETHDRESPTIRTVMEVLKDMAENPREHVIQTPKEAKHIEQQATELLSLLRPFVQGQFENLSQHSEFDLRDEDVIYLDLQQQESSSSGGGLMMQLVFSLVYERAKETPKNVVFVIDEARFLMRDAKSLDFLGQRVRHSRHYDTSIRFITQNLQDFFGHEEAESIMNNSFVKIFHRLEEIKEEKWQNVFGLNETQADFVYQAQTGENGYSEALANIDGQWYPLQIFTTEAEHAVIDFDERTGDVSDLPGEGMTDSEVAQSIRNYLESAVREQVTEEDLTQAWQAFTPVEQQYASLLGESELTYVLEQITLGGRPTDLLIAALTEKFERLFGDVDPEFIEAAITTQNEQYQSELESGANSQEEGNASHAASDPRSTSGTGQLAPEQD